MEPSFCIFSSFLLNTSVSDSLSLLKATCNLFSDNTLGKNSTSLSSKGDIFLFHAELQAHPLMLNLFDDEAVYKN